VLTEDVELYSVLNHPKACEYFLDHQRKEFNADNIEFWLAAEKYFRTYRRTPITEDIVPRDTVIDQLAAVYPVRDEATTIKLVSEIIKSGRANTVGAAKEALSRWERRSMALSITAIFIEEYAEKQQNISGDMRNKLIKRVQNDEFPPDLFHEAQDQVYRMMQEPFHRFKRTRDFEDLLEYCGCYKKTSLWNIAKLKIESSPKGRVSGGTPVAGSTVTKKSSLATSLLAMSKKMKEQSTTVAAPDNNNNNDGSSNTPATSKPASPNSGRLSLINTITKSSPTNNSARAPPSPTSKGTARGPPSPVDNNTYRKDLDNKNEAGGREDLQSR